MAVNVPPGSDGNPPFDGISVSGKRAALLLLEQMKNQVAAIEAWVQTVTDPGSDVPAEGPPSPPPPPAKPKKPGKKHHKGRR